jgi:iron complex transport system substrate-binding protein
MRAFGWLSAASLALTGCAAAPTIPAGGEAPRVASLKLCTDELLLLLAEPEGIVSLTHLAGRDAESPLASQARAYPANDGTLADVFAQRPSLVLTMGGGGDRLRIAQRMGIRLIDLPFPQNIDDVIASIRTVAAALEREAQGEELIARIEALRRTRPARSHDTLWIGGGGRSVAANGLEAEWMALAGYRQREVGGGIVALEDMLATPPTILLRSDYRDGQYSRGQAWLEHPLARARGGSREVATDGRRWTCLGPLLIDEIERLRRERPA